MDGDRPEMSVKKKNLPQGASSCGGGVAPIAACSDARSSKIATGTQDAKRPRLPIFALMSGRPLETFATTATAAIAQQQSNPAVKLFSSTEVIVSSLVGGPLRAALLSALWLVRQRGNIEAETQEMRSALSEAQQSLAAHTFDLQSLLRISYAVF